MQVVRVQTAGHPDEKTTETEGNGFVPDHVYADAGRHCLVPLDGREPCAEVRAVDAVENQQSDEHDGEDEITIGQ